MGTRNLTCVVKNGQYKVAKYGQWDGYPTSLGIGILEFLRNEFDRSTFERNLDKVQFISDEQAHALWTECGADDSDWVNMEVSERFKQKYFALSRDCGGDDVLALIQEGKVDKQQSSLEFAADGLFCEWCYVVDLDKNTFEVYTGFNQTQLDPSERFANVKPTEKADTKYSPVKFVKEYSLDNLPSNGQFLTDVNI